ncbi:sensor domain-containing protein [Amycolatopsis sp. PS_44_ISF1]|uniref:sensor histidine kinase n=1 Tax=Amycolatopsis sp. PS_44_ISF1 TaxID=2974917 RepID=UPI0028DD4124|nr:sensor domain-containing protein [Amycolatopsis sp. PS_44_ISF1]MDT8915398.1 sensor domain-containing protein [Amycolatopsis sp. PS_44_ISF1]
MKLDVLLRPPRATAREAAWLLLAGVFSPVALIVVLAGIATGIALSPLVVGPAVLAAALSGARALGAGHRRLAGALLGGPVQAPRPAALRPGLWHWLEARIGDPVAWRAVAYLLVRLPWTVAGLLLTGLPLLYAGATIGYPVLWFFLHGAVLPVFGIHSGPWAGSLLWAASGIAVLAVVPWLLHGSAVVDRALVTGLLGRRRLRERVQDLEASRSAAVEDAALRLRRIERDLHDGAQAQLVALAMRLGLAKEELSAEAVDLGQVRELVATAHAGAKQALTELRDLARGIHPAALDAGLDVALPTLAATTGIDTRVEVRLPRRPPPSIETILYFTAAELLTNAAKHSHSPVRLAVTEDDGFLRLLVADPGPGGAAVVPGGGLAGLAERLRTVDGGLSVTSPPGGPTTVTATVPVRA